MADPDQPAAFVAGRLDLDAAAAARREGRGDRLQVTWAGQEFLLPAELPEEAVDRLAGLADHGDALTAAEQSGDEREAMRLLRKVGQTLDAGLAVLFCTCEDVPEPAPEAPAGVHPAACQFRAWRRTRPSIETRMTLVEAVMTAYGASLGELSAATQQRAGGGGRSPHPSKGSTASTRASSGGGSGTRRRGRGRGRR